MRRPPALDRDLRRAEHVAGRMKGHARRRRASMRLAVADRLRGAGEIVAVAQPHQVERLLRRQHRAVAGARVVGVAVRDHGLVHRPGRIDVEPAAACSTRRRASATRISSGRIA